MSGREPIEPAPRQQAEEIFSAIQYDFALSSRTVFYGMAIAFVVALIWMPAGKVEELPEEAEPTAAA